MNTRKSIFEILLPRTGGRKRQLAVLGFIALTGCAQSTLQKEASIAQALTPLESCVATQLEAGNENLASLIAICGPDVLSAVATLYAKSTVGSDAGAVPLSRTAQVHAEAVLQKAGR